MWAVMRVCRHVCHTQAQCCLSTGWALDRCFAWGFRTVAVLAQGGGGGQGTLVTDWLYHTVFGVSFGSGVIDRCISNAQCPNTFLL